MSSEVTQPYQQPTPEPKTVNTEMAESLCHFASIQSRLYPEQKRVLNNLTHCLAGKPALLNNLHDQERLELWQQQVEANLTLATHLLVPDILIDKAMIDGQAPNPKEKQELFFRSYSSNSYQHLTPRDLFHLAVYCLSADL